MLACCCFERMEVEWSFYLKWIWFHVTFILRRFYLILPYAFQAQNILISIIYWIWQFFKKIIWIKQWKNLYRMVCLSSPNQNQAIRKTNRKTFNVKKKMHHCEMKSVILSSATLLIPPTQWTVEVNCFWTHTQLDAIEKFFCLHTKWPIPLISYSQCKRIDDKLDEHLVIFLCTRLRLF